MRSRLKPYWQLLNKQNKSVVLPWDRYVWQWALVICYCPEVVPQSYEETDWCWRRKKKKKKKHSPPWDPYYQPRHPGNALMVKIDRSWRESNHLVLAGTSLICVWSGHDLNSRTTWVSRNSWSPTGTSTLAPPPPPTPPLQHISGKDHDRRLRW